MVRLRESGWLEGAGRRRRPVVHGDLRAAARVGGGDPDPHRARGQLAGREREPDRGGIVDGLPLVGRELRRAAAADGVGDRPPAGHPGIGWMHPGQVGPVQEAARGAIPGPDPEHRAGRGDPAGRHVLPGGHGPGGHRHGPGGDGQLTLVQRLGVAARLHQRAGEVAVGLRHRPVLGGGVRPAHGGGQPGRHPGHGAGHGAAPGRGDQAVQAQGVHEAHVRGGGRWTSRPP